MKALILAGGPGTRLRPFVPDRPKPMAETGGKPFLEYQIEQLRAHQFRELVFCVGHLAHQIQEYFGDGRRWGVRITYAVETELLGTAGATKNAGDFLADTFLVLNGDSYLEVDLRSLVEFHRRWQMADPRTIGTIAIVAMDNAAGYGALELDARDRSLRRILRFREKACAGPAWINGGIYVLEPDILDFIPANRVVSIERETFPLVLERGRHLLGYPMEGFFVDIGTPQGYRRFCQYVERGSNDRP